MQKTSVLEMETNQVVQTLQDLANTAMPVQHYDIFTEDIAKAGSISNWRGLVIGSMTDHVLKSLSFEMLAQNDSEKVSDIN